MTNESADRIAEAIETINSLVNEELDEREAEYKQRARRHADPAMTASSKQMAVLRAQRAEHFENFSLLLNIVADMARHGSVDCESVLTKFIEDYKNSF